jgi:hypothetical protein
MHAVTEGAERVASGYFLETGAGLRQMDPNSILEFLLIP